MEYNINKYKYIKYKTKYYQLINSINGGNEPAIGSSIKIANKDNKSNDEIIIKNLIIQNHFLLEK